jgi:hypothetical protein
MNLIVWAQSFIYEAQIDIFYIHISVHRNILVIPNYSQQDATFLGLFNFKDALHVSGGSFAHHQEHIIVHTWAEEPPETCRASLKINTSRNVAFCWV